MVLVQQLYMLYTHPLSHSMKNSDDTPHTKGYQQGNRLSGWASKNGL